MGICARAYKFTVPLTYWEAVYNGLAHSGRLPDAFPEAEGCTFAEFLKAISQPGRHSWLMAFGKQLGGVVYIGDRVGTRACVHFAFLPLGRRHIDGVPAPVALARFALASILRDKDEHGDYVLDCLIGVTPAYNRAAVTVAKESGGVILGELPFMQPLAGAKRNIPAVISYFTRASTDDAWTRY
jgi:hypothetical protein